MQNKVILPSYVIGQNCYECFEELCAKYGNRCILIYGEKAYEAVSQYFFDAIKDSEMQLINSFLYGKDATYENAKKIISEIEPKHVDFIIAMGGGKCIDTAKYVADLCELPIITLPTIASTCAATTKISIMYNKDGSFLNVYSCKNAPVFCLINSKVITNAPIMYLWAGIGDTVAKNVETYFSSRNDTLNFQNEFALQVSNMCFDSILKHGIKAYKDAKNNEVTNDLEITIQNILISTGIVSLLIDAKYNSALAHSLFYGFTSRKVVEENHLHGEVVAYGVLVQLMLDSQMEKLALAYNFYKLLKLPTCLKDLDIDIYDDLNDVIELTLKNKELEHIPYPITHTMIKNAINDLEKYAL